MTIQVIDGVLEGVPMRNKLLTQKTLLTELPPEFAEIMHCVWIRGEPKRFFQSKHPRFDDCWVYEGSTATRGGSGTYPRISRHNRKGFSLRRHVAEIFYDFDAIPEIYRVYVRLGCGNKECINPKHMKLTIGPGVRLT